MNSHRAAQILLELPDYPLVTTEQESRGFLDPWGIRCVIVHHNSIELSYTDPEWLSHNSPFKIIS